MTERQLLIGILLFAVACLLGSVAAFGQDSNWQQFQLQQRLDDLEAQIQRQQNWRQFELEARRRDQNWHDSFHDLDYEHRPWSGGTLRGGHEDLLDEDTWD